ncbi:metallophosphoesterase [Candidatus Methylacidiphilum infernorum]|uniref:Calcineurin-like phosphohydrolase n=1 Tax=Methylacidiphilum infernorum (isolate V4) TaxID=481448 RepID=B3DY32_METI4|nr:metallophosphoesterase [Candidatus Methylacidiphilum infernorum]ACD83984.1 Calcineurin-like phosphohydrolase [Methylacidiphilum infernorum V4]
MRRVFFLALYYGLSGYVVLRGFLVLPHLWLFQGAYLLICAWAVFGYFLFSYLKDWFYMPLINGLLAISSLWLPGVIYLFVGICLVDMGWLITPGSFHSLFSGRSWIIALGMIGTVGGVLLKGYFNALNVEIKKIELHIEKKCPLGSLRVVVASDIHAGGTIGKRRLSIILKKILSLDPDLILLPGDLLDGSKRVLEKEGIEHFFKSLSAGYGVYSCIGNHECFYDSDSLSSFLENCGIAVLRDETRRVDDFFYVVGRDDQAVEIIEGKAKRKTLREILKNCDRSKPILVMDHRPTAIDEAVREQVDLLVCGHTHQGQFWPINHIVDRLFPLSYGYRKIGLSHIVVTRGAGTWGPPVRVGQRSEIMLLHLFFHKE